jgi:hypothetical protein
LALAESKLNGHSVPEIGITMGFPIAPDGRTICFTAIGDSRFCLGEVSEESSAYLVSFPNFSLLAEDV